MKKAESKTNRHGLKRYIDKPIQQQIRKDAGYGCVVCGTLFCDYEHIEPEFNDAKIHDPEKMTLLCESCHGKVTGKRKSKRRVWEAKAKPYCKEHSMTHYEIEPCISPNFKIGNSVFHDIEIIISIHGKPLVWLDSPALENEPFEVSAIFHDNNGKYIASLNRNQFTSSLGSHDIWGEGTRIEVRPEKGVIGLTLDIEADEPINIKRINMNYLGNSLEVTKGGMLIFNNNRFDGFHVSSGHTAMYLGDIPSTPLKEISVATSYTLLNVAYFVARAGKIIQTINGNKAGWLLGNLILNTNYQVVGFHNDSNVFTITEEYIGKLVAQDKGNYLLANPNNEYENYEPIWVSLSDQKTKNIKVDAYVDVSHRLFGITPTKRYINSSKNEPELIDNIKSVGKQKLSKNNNRYQQTLDITKIGDRVKINFEGKIEGYVFDGGKAEDFPLEIGSRRMIPGFEEGIVGKKCGETFDIEVQFPQEYHAENLKGKKAVFTITLNSVERLSENS